jgi:hypothetical protein
MHPENQRRQRTSPFARLAVALSFGCSSRTPDRAPTLEPLALPSIPAIAAPLPSTVDTSTAPLPPLQPCATSVPVVATPISKQEPALRPILGEVAIGSPMVTGRPIPNAPAVVTGMRGRLTACYSTGLEQDRSMRGGGLEIVASVGPDGCVVATQEKCGAGLSGSVRACIAKRVEGACFGAPVSLPTTVTIPLSCQPAPDLDARREPPF